MCKDFWVLLMYLGVFVFRVITASLQYTPMFVGHDEYIFFQVEKIQIKRSSTVVLHLFRVKPIYYNKGKISNVTQQRFLVILATERIIFLSGKTGINIAMSWQIIKYLFQLLWICPYSPTPELNSCHDATRPLGSLNTILFSSTLTE